MTAAITGDFSQVDDLFLNRQEAIEAIGEREVSQLEQLDANLRTTLSNITVQRQQLLANNALQYYQTEQTYKNDYKGSVITAFQNHYVGGGTDDNLQTVIDDIALRSNNLFSTAELRTLAEQGKALARGETTANAGAGKSNYQLANLGQGTVVVFNPATGETEERNFFGDAETQVDEISVFANFVDKIGIGDAEVFLGANYGDIKKEGVIDVERQLATATFNNLQRISTLEDKQGILEWIQQELKDNNQEFIDFFGDLVLKTRKTRGLESKLEDADIENFRKKYSDILGDIISIPPATSLPATGVGGV